MNLHHHHCEYDKTELKYRVNEELYNSVSKIPLKNGVITYHETARIISMHASDLCSINSSHMTKPHGKVIVACAGNPILT